MATAFSAEFLGNKTALAPWIAEAITESVAPQARISDLFCGTASLSAHLRALGYSVHSNDLLPLCVTWAKARVLAPQNPDFEGLREVLPLGGGDPLDAVISHLNSLPPSPGWITQNYTPASLGFCGHERRYITEANGARIDAVRSEIKRLQPWLTDAEHSLLLTSLVVAISSVSNVAGTYGAFLKTWKSRALQTMFLEAIRPGPGPVEGHTVTAVDAATAASESDVDLAYADPPYTKRQYAAYYHLLNSVVLDNEPELSGSTGLPQWRDWASDWCYSRRAPGELDRLVAKCSAPTFVLSYSSDGHISHDSIVDILGAYGTVTFQNLQYRRYKSSRLDHQASTVTERLYVMKR